MGRSKTVATEVAAKASLRGNRILELRASDGRREGLRPAGSKLQMKRPETHRHTVGVTLLELLCVIAVITILAGMLLGPVSRIMQKSWAMKWSEDGTDLLDTVVERLRQHYQGREDFPQVTLTTLEAGGLLDSAQLRFLKDRRVTFFPFAGTDPDEQVVIAVRFEAGFLVDRHLKTASKGDICRSPE